MRMKIMFVVLIVSAFCLVGFDSNQTNPFEGNWELLHAEGTWGTGAEMINIKMVKDENCYGMKVINDGYFMFVGQDKVTGELAPHYGYGTYTFKDNIYTEHIIYHVDKDSIGKSASYEMTVEEGKLIQKGPLTIGDYKDIDWGITETYVRK